MARPARQPTAADVFFPDVPYVIATAYTLDEALH